MAVALIPPKFVALYHRNTKIRMHSDLLDNVIDGNADKSAIKCGYIYHTTSECLVQQQ